MLVVCDESCPVHCRNQTVERDFKLKSEPELQENNILDDLIDDEKMIRLCDEKMIKNESFQNESVTNKVVGKSVDSIIENLSSDQEASEKNNMFKKQISDSSTAGLQHLVQSELENQKHTAYKKKYTSTKISDFCCGLSSPPKPTPRTAGTVFFVRKK